MHYIDHKYLGIISSHLSGWTSLGNDIYNFRCPYCGDSKQNKSKRRGYLYPLDDTVIYKCHNCGASVSLYDFILHLSSSTAEQYRFDKFIEPKKRTQKEREVDPSLFKTEMVFKQTNILDKCVKLTELPTNHHMIQYVQNRKVPQYSIDRLYYVDDMNTLYSNLENYKTKEKFEYVVDAIVIPFFDESGENITHVQCRTMSKTVPYITLEVAPSEYKIWGLDCIDWTKRVWVFEGPFDAMMMKNSVAVAGAGSMKHNSKYLLTKSKDCVFVFDKDYETNFQVYTQFKKLINIGANVVIFDSEFKWNDVNDAVKSGWSVEKLETYLDSKIRFGLQANLELSTFKPPKKR